MLKGDLEVYIKYGIYKTEEDPTSYLEYPYEEEFQNIIKRLWGKDIQWNIRFIKVAIFNRYETPPGDIFIWDIVEGKDFTFDEVLELCMDRKYKFYNPDIGYITSLKVLSGTVFVNIDNSYDKNKFPLTGFQWIKENYIDT